MTTPASTQFRVHLLIGQENAFKTTHDVWAGSPEYATTFAKSWAQREYPGQRVVVGKVKQLRVDMHGRGWYRGKGK